MTHPSQLSTTSGLDLLTPQRLAKALDVPLSTVYYWTSRKQIPFIKMGRHVRFNLQQVLEHFETETREQRRACNLFGIRVGNKLTCSLKTEETGQVDPRRKGF